MINLAIPVWSLIFCAGNIVGIVACVLLVAWLNRRQRNKMLDELNKIAVEFEAPEGGEGDAVDQR